MYPEVFGILIAVATASLAATLSIAPTGTPQYARIVNLQNDLDSSGAFSYSYETENGIKAEARGIVNNAGVPDKEEQVVTGSYSFVSDNGQVYSVTYVADSNGFRAFGDHIPTSAAPGPGSRSLPSPKPLPLRPRDEVDDLARWRGDPQGLTPPPPPPSSPPPNFPAGLVIVPSRNPRRRQQEFFETIVY